MSKLKYLFIITAVSVFLLACGDDAPKIPKPFNHKSQAKKDKDSIAKFIAKHYYDVDEGRFKKLIDGKTALSDDDKLISISIKENNIDYKMYQYTVNEGTTTNPSLVDSVLVNYKGVTMINSNLGNKFDQNKVRWLTLGKGSVIDGWTYGIPKMKGGENISVASGKIKYQNYGTAIFIIPSGLAYKNTATYTLPANRNLIFYIDLLDVNNETDHDRDGIPSSKEDIDNDGKPWNDDTDKDGKPNYLDTDDDNDNIYTKYEDANNDGDPTNDFNDPKKPTVPDYLNKKIKSISK